MPTPATPTTTTHCEPAWNGDRDRGLRRLTGGVLAGRERRWLPEELWLHLARDRATTHPADAIPILLAAADQAINHKNRNSYQLAVKLLVEAKPLFWRCDRQTDFESHLRTVRAAHKPKRALREELDRAGLP